MKRLIWALGSWLALIAAELRRVYVWHCCDSAVIYFTLTFCDCAGHSNAVSMDATAGKTVCKLVTFRAVVCLLYPMNTNQTKVKVQHFNTLSSKSQQSKPTAGMKLHLDMPAVPCWLDGHFEQIFVVPRGASPPCRPRLFLLCSLLDGELWTYDRHSCLLQAKLWSAWWSLHFHCSTIVSSTFRTSSIIMSNIFTNLLPSLHWQPCVRLVMALIPESENASDPAENAAISISRYTSLLTVPSYFPVSLD